MPSGGRRKRGGPRHPQPLRMPGAKGEEPRRLGPEPWEKHTVVVAPNPLHLAVPHGSAASRAIKMYFLSLTFTRRPSHWR